MPYTLDLGINNEEAYLQIAEEVLTLNLREEKELELNRFFLLAIIQRAMMTSRGIEILYQDDNYEAAIPLMRILLDCALHIKASKMADNEEKYYNSILSGGQIRDNKDSHGKKLSEKNVAKSFDNENWVGGVYNVYDALNKHVHFSPTHIRQIVGKDKKISIGMRMISTEQEHVNNIKEYYNCITTVVIRMLEVSLDGLKQRQQ